MEGYRYAMWHWGCFEKYILVVCLQLQVNLLALAQRAPRIGHGQVGLHGVLADHRLVAQQVVLSRRQGGGGGVRGVVGHVALDHRLCCLPLQHLQVARFEFCLAVVICCRCVKR